MENFGMWKAILEWSLRTQDGTQQASSVTPLAEEDRKFLEAVMADLLVDDVARMKAIVAIIKLPEHVTSLDAALKEMAATEELARKAKLQADLAGTDAKSSTSAAPNNNNNNNAPAEAELQQLQEQIVQRKVRALDDLDDIVSSLDLANDLHKVGGFVPLVSLLRSDHIILRAKAAQVLATVVQNNPKTQVIALQMNVVPLLVANLELKDATEDVIANNLSAISCLIRTSTTAMNQFLDADGYTILVRLVTSPNTPLRALRKSLSILSHMWHKGLHSKLPDHSTIPSALTRLLGHPDIDCYENSLKCIHDLLSTPTNIAQFQPAELGLKEQLTKRKAEIEAITDAEERMHAQDELARIADILSKI